MYNNRRHITILRVPGFEHLNTTPPELGNCLSIRFPFGIEQCFAHGIDDSFNPFSRFWVSDVKELWAAQVSVIIRIADCAFFEFRKLFEKCVFHFLDPYFS